MANERKTEQFVRNHFKAFEKDFKIKIEEQQTENHIVEKLLSTASKSGKGKGYPDFLIHYEDYRKFIIVIECKAENKYHKSRELNNPKNYAVDGVLLYSEYLSKEFDVLSIAVSGQTKKDLAVTHHLKLKNSFEKPVKKFGNHLLPISDYLKGYQHSEEKIKQEYDILSNFSKKLNKKLHAEKIKGSERALLVSAILIALEHRVFKETFADEKNLSTRLFDVLKEKYQNSDIEENKLESIMENFLFIKSNESLKNQNVLIQIIKDVEDNINSFTKTHKYYDVLSVLYIEFLRYANDDKSLGIVLTPKHITEFMIELADVNKKSVVYDNCAGTGGFLVAAMRTMIKDAKGNQKEIDNIKKNSLIGTEFQSSIYTLAISNMYIHQDGKTNMLRGDCFKHEIIKKVKNRKPNVGLLNPPYKSKQNKKHDNEELKFVLNNLESLQQNGKCVAILPMQTALATTGKILELKKKILKNHTLEAVFSMPDELFHNSNVNVVTCIMIFTAWKPHSNNKEVFFGYFKDDGFVKRKEKGRIDVYGNWSKNQKTWIEFYKNKKNISGITINKLVNAHDEWCAEAYMKTNLNLSKKDFEKAVRDFLSFKISNNY